MKIRLQTGYLDIRKDDEDIVLTPFIGGILGKNETPKCYLFALSVNWIYYSFYIGIGFNIPIELPYFINHSKK